MAEYSWTARYRAALNADPQFLLESVQVALEELKERRFEIGYPPGFNREELRNLACAVSDLHIIKLAFLSNNPLRVATQAEAGQSKVPG